MKVKDVMNKEVKTISPDTPLRMVNQIMQKNEVEGIITYTDLVRLIIPS